MSIDFPNYLQIFIFLNLSRLVLPCRSVLHIAQTKTNQMVVLVPRIMMGKSIEPKCVYRSKGKANVGTKKGVHSCIRLKAGTRFTHATTLNSVDSWHLLEGAIAWIVS
jgi:hypothetical protein